MHQLPCPCYICGWQVRVRYPSGPLPTFCFSGVVSTPSGQQLERVRAAADRVARSYGLEVFDVQLRRESVGTVLRVIIDRPDSGVSTGVAPLEEESVGIADCQRVSQDLSALLDVEEDDLETAAIGHAYTLEVSSPGLDRPLRHEADYRRFRGRLAKLVTSEPVEGQTAFAGRLAGVDDGMVLLEEGRKMHRVPLSRIKRGRLEAEF
ncbi:MAG: ribosome maturation factor RimP [Acidobacteria bacterium]|nr:ribosome maturation factor RimP [Acidobacteriota bacterium]